MYFDIEEFLKKSVYYPCSHFHWKPIESVGSICSNYLYADAAVNYEELQENISEDSIDGYSLIRQEDIRLENLLCGEYQVENQHGFYWEMSFAVHFLFRRLPGYQPERNPKYINLVFTDGEGVAIFNSVYASRNISPVCLVYIRCMGHGAGNYDDYPELLDRSMKGNPAGLPRFLLVDNIGCTEDFWGSLPTVAQYIPQCCERYWSDDHKGDRCHFLGTRKSDQNYFYQPLPNGVNCDNLSWSEVVYFCCKSS